MGEPKPEAILKEAIYESGAVPRTTELTVNFFRPNKENLDYICIARVVVDEAEISADAKMQSIVHNVAACIFGCAPEIQGVTVWLQIDPYASPDGRYSSLSRKDFDAGLPVKITLELKKILTDYVIPQLTADDRAQIKAQDIDYPELCLLLRIKLSDAQSQLFGSQEDIFKEKIFNIAKDIMQNTFLIKSVSTTLFPQNLTTRIERQSITQNFDFHSMKFDPPSLVSQRSRHLS